MGTKEELYLEYARCINMCKGTEVKPWECVRLIDVPGKFDRHPRFEYSSDCYKFAIFILEDKPVFPGDILYFKDGTGEKCEVDREGYRTKNDELTIFIYEDWRRYVPGVKCGWSWNPPVQKETFTVNGVELPCPTNHSKFIGFNSVMIRSHGFVENFTFNSNASADSFVSEITKILKSTIKEEGVNHENNSSKSN